MWRWSVVNSEVCITQSLPNVFQCVWNGLKQAYILLLWLWLYSLFPISYGWWMNQHPFFILTSTSIVVVVVVSSSSVLDCLLYTHTVAVVATKNVPTKANHKTKQSKRQQSRRGSHLLSCSNYY